MNLDPDLLAAERAIDEVRSGRPLVVCDDDGAFVYAALETLRPSALDHMRTLAPGPWTLLVTPQRARAMGLADAGIDVVRLPLPDAGMLAHALELATAERVTGIASTGGDAMDRAVIGLMKTAWLLPAALRAPWTAPAAAQCGEADRFAAGLLLRVTGASLAALSERMETRVERISEARIPLHDAADARFICFRSALGAREHLAIVIGNPEPQAGVPVRLHSACLTGDVFGSLRCDCGEQLRQSVAALKALGGGVLLYLAQEGRGIGLANKLRAYALQDAGRDTIDADLQLGFSPDERQYAVAAAMLLALGYDRIRLMTNNPDKVEALHDAGISILERLPLLADITPQNRRYMDAKRDRARHILEPVSGGS